MPDRRRDYGEPRLSVLCPVHGRLLHITYTPRGGVRRIISARAASRREQRFYGRAADHQGDRDP
ncbi:MAG: BrnT family toxin [Geminicoccaceae bacterium]|nr:BrnT family toxin [Geminicoccaceae bacterium]